MTRFILTLLTLMFISSLSYGQLRFGAGGAIVSDFDAIGIQGKVLLDLEERTGRPIDGAATFTLVLGDSTKDWAIDIDSHYRLFTFGDDIEIEVEPLGGLQISRGGLDATDIGINLGGNIVFPFESFLFYAQPKITIGGFGGFTFSGGILF